MDHRDVIKPERFDSDVDPHLLNQINDPDAKLLAESMGKLRTEMRWGSEKGLTAYNISKYQEWWIETNWPAIKLAIEQSAENARYIQLHAPAIKLAIEQSAENTKFISKHGGPITFLFWILSLVIVAVVSAWAVDKSKQKDEKDLSVAPSKIAPAFHGMRRTPL